MGNKRLFVNRSGMALDFVDICLVDPGPIRESSGSHLGVIWDHFKYFWKLGGPRDVMRGSSSGVITDAMLSPFYKRFLSASWLLEC